MQLDRSNIKKILGIVAFGVLLYVGAQNVKTVTSFLAGIAGLLTPFILGFSMAFIMNVLLKLIEEKLFATLNRKKLPLWERYRRPVCLILSILLLLGLVFVLIFMIVPEITRTIELIVAQLPGQMDQFFTWAQEKLASLQIPEEAIPHIQIDWSKVVDVVTNTLKNGGSAVFNTTIGITSSIVGGVMNFILGSVFSIYLLLQKEELTRQLKRALYAFLPEHRVKRILEVGSLTNRIFGKFVSGQCIEAVILGALCFVGMTIFSMPYAMLVSMMVGVTALIPMLGAFIGSGIGVFLILMVDPMTAVWFLVYIVILQQLEGNLIYPRVVGKSVGLPGLWVLVAVTIGGSLWGILGILVSVPVCSVLYTLLREAINIRLAKKHVCPPAQEEHPTAQQHD